MQLINSIWLWGLAAVSVPLLIHLWNVRQGKVLRVGSIALMQAASRKSSRSLKLTDVLLLTIRCLIVALLALLLARPVWQQRAAAAKAKGWVLIPEILLAETYRHYRPQLDSLQKAGFELHSFGAGFKAIDSLQLQKLLHTIRPAGTTTPANYWMLLNRLNSRLPAATPVYLFTTAQLKHFAGARPAVALNLHWQTFTPADSVSTWIHRAWFTPGDHIRVVTGTSRPGGTTYGYTTISAAPPAGSPFRLQTSDGRLTVQLKSDAGAPVMVDTSIQRFAVYTDKYPEDARYVNAALQTVVQFNQRKAVIKQYSNGVPIAGKQDWLFWLSDKPIPAALARNAKQILGYAPGKASLKNSWFNFTPGHLPADQNPVVNLYRSVPAGKAPQNQSKWADGFGRPLLSLAQTATGRQYLFYSRFAPAWNDLVWDERFPQVLLQLISPLAENDITHDRRVLSRSQYMPLPGTNTYSSSTAARQTDLRMPVWLLLALLLLTERLLAHRRKTLPSYE